MGAGTRSTSGKHPCCQRDYNFDKAGRQEVDRDNRERITMPEIKTGNWYFVVTCKNCQAMVAFGNAPPAGVVEGIEVNHGPISIHCDGCGVDKVYAPQEISIRQAKQPPLMQ